MGAHVHVSIATLLKRGRQKQSACATKASAHTTACLSAAWGNARPAAVEHQHLLVRWGQKIVTGGCGGDLVSLICHCLCCQLKNHDFHHVQKCTDACIAAMLLVGWAGQQA